jgi:hypothetical protein
MHVDDLDISPSKIAETSQRIVDRALEDARRRQHPLVTNEHLFLAFTQVEWDLFAEVMRDVGLNPHTILQAIGHLRLMPSRTGPGAAGLSIHESRSGGCTRQAARGGVVSAGSARGRARDPGRPVSISLTVSSRLQW